MMHSAQEATGLPVSTGRSRSREWSYRDSVTKKSERIIETEDRLREDR